MPKICYEKKRFSQEREILIREAVDIISYYETLGYTLTLRQLYYQFVARDLLPASWADPKTGSTNNEKSYMKLGNVIGDARLAGLIDWTAIEDRTRNLDGNTHWISPASIVAACSHQFMLDKWVGQEYRVEVWVEKDALEGLVGKAARSCDVDFFSCRGYASMTSIWDAGQRLKRYARDGQRPVILHLGDHDPSGIDMSRDIEDRVTMFMDEYSGDLIFKRIALTWAQIQTHNPPPNPAKHTDSRYKSYSDAHGDECWELDALDPSVIDSLITNEVLAFRDESLFQEQEEREQEHRDDLTAVSSKWDTIVKHARKGGKNGKS